MWALRPVVKGKRQNGPFEQVIIRLAADAVDEGQFRGVRSGSCSPFSRREELQKVASGIDVAQRHVWPGAYCSLSAISEDAR
jgi:hypothetical protein